MNSVRLALAACVLPAVVVCRASADHPAAPGAGHSVYGESFSEGPRQKAVLLPGVAGLCHFPVTTSRPEAQQFFDQGVAQLHGFWFLEAERSFRQVLQLDPDCTTALWGIAMANVENPARAGKILADGAARKRDHLTPRERAWLDSLAEYYQSKKDEKTRRRDLVRAWEQIVADHPDDPEARAFLVGLIWRNHGQDLKITSHAAVDALAREVLAKAPRHPGIHHYRVHLWNNEKDARALDSAAALGPAGPGIAHNWHMPGHTYSALKRFADAAWQQEASARVDHAYLIRHHIMPDEIHNYAHNNGWLIENYVYLGRAREAVALAKNLIGLPRVPRGKVGINVAGQDWEKNGSAWSEGRRRLFAALLDLEQWEEVIALESSPHLERSGDFDEDLRLDHLMAISHFETGDQLGGLRRVVALFERERSLESERDAAASTAEESARNAKKSDREIEAAADAARKPWKDKLSRMRDAVGELLVVQKLAAGDIDGAKKNLAELSRVPAVRLARYHSRAGDHAKAIELAKKSAADDAQQVAPLAGCIAVLTAGGSADADSEFEKFRSVGAFADDDLRAIRRLGTRTAGSWKRPPAPAGDLGERPPLDQLGPAHWSPAPAAPFQLSDAAGTLRSLADFRGRPVLLLFYLGRACTHCMEQLNAFAPKSADFTAAGITILAVGTDTADGLRETLTRDSNPFPFPLLADPTLAAFKAYRAFDDFENSPLHSTVFIDGAGRIRWQHVSFSPFMKPDFLLEEATRLLKLPAANAELAGP